MHFLAPEIHLEINYGMKVENKYILYIFVAELIKTQNPQTNTSASLVLHNFVHKRETLEYELNVISGSHTV